MSEPSPSITCLFIRAEHLLLPSYHMSQELGPLASIKDFPFHLFSPPLTIHSHAVFQQEIQTIHLLIRRPFHPHPLLLPRDQCTQNSNHHHPTSTHPLQELQTLHHTKTNHKHNGPPPKTQKHHRLLRPQIQHPGPIQVRPHPPKLSAASPTHQH